MDTIRFGLLTGNFIIFLLYLFYIKILNYNI